MMQRLAPWFGAAVLVLVAGFLAAFGRAAVADPVTLALLAGLVVAAGLSIVGGFRESVAVGPLTVPWNVLVGASDVLVALAVVISSVRTAGLGGTGGRLIAAGAIVGGAALAWFGVQTARDTRHVDLEATPSRARLAAIGALAVLSAGAGFLVATGV